MDGFLCLENLSSPMKVHFVSDIFSYASLSLVFKYDVYGLEGNYFRTRRDNIF